MEQKHNLEVDESYEQKYRGFVGLANKYFGGNQYMASQYVADLGRAAYFYSMKPSLSIEAMRKWAAYMPKIFIWSKNQIVDINWKSERMIAIRESRVRL
jgi:hypothetical protein